MPKERLQANKSKARQRKAAMLIANGATFASAMREAGYSELAIAKRSHDTIQGIRDEFLQVLHAEIPNSKILAKLQEGLEATHAVVVMDGKGVSHMEMVPDYHARVKYLQLAAQLGGLIVRKVEQKHDIGPQVADVIAAARRRVTGSQAIPERPALPDVTADVTAEPTEPDKSAS